MYNNIIEVKFELSVYEQEHRLSNVIEQVSMCANMFTPLGNFQWSDNYRRGSN